jgi:hypothetical protein
MPFIPMFNFVTIEEADVKAEQPEALTTTKPSPSRVSFPFGDNFVAISISLSWLWLAAVLLHSLIENLNTFAW